MGKTGETPARNEFAEAQQKARELLKLLGDLDFLDKLDLEEGDGYGPIPFPYGPQPGRRTGWKETRDVMRHYPDD